MARRSNPQSALRKTIAPAAIAPWAPGGSIARVPINHAMIRQGEPCADIIFLHAGTAKIHMISPLGREAVIMILGAGEFFGEGSLLDHAQRIATVTALSECMIERIEVATTWQLLRDNKAFAKKLIDFLVSRNRRYLRDLSDHHFHSTEQRLARTLLQLPTIGGENGQPATTPWVSQSTLAGMIGTTRSRVNFFMNRFRELGMIEYNNKGDGDFIVHSALERILEQE